MTLSEKQKQTRSRLTDQKRNEIRIPRNHDNSHATGIKTFRHASTKQVQAGTEIQVPFAPNRQYRTKLVIDTN